MLVVAGGVHAHESTREVAPRAEHIADIALDEPRFELCITARAGHEVEDKPPGVRYELFHNVIIAQSRRISEPGYFKMDFSCSAGGWYPSALWESRCFVL